MAEIPRDPRQLARDILSGKIKLEDLQRERQRQGAPPAARNAPAPPAPAPPQRSQPVKEVPIGPGTRMPEQVRNQPRPAPPPAPPRPPARPPQSPGKNRPSQQKKAPAPPPPPKRTEQVIAPVQAEYEQAHDVAAKPRKAVPPTASVRDLMKSPLAVRQGFLLSEVLGKPVALRDEF